MTNDLKYITLKVSELLKINRKNLQKLEGQKNVSDPALLAEENHVLSVLRNTSQVHENKMLRTLVRQNLLSLCGRYCLKKKKGD